MDTNSRSLFNDRDVDEGKAILFDEGYTRIVMEEMSSGGVGAQRFNNKIVRRLVWDNKTSFGHSGKKSKSASTLTQFFSNEEQIILYATPCREEEEQRIEGEFYNDYVEDIKDGEATTRPTSGHESQRSGRLSLGRGGSTRGSTRQSGHFRATIVRKS